MAQGIDIYNHMIGEKILEYVADGKNCGFSNYCLNRNGTWWNNRVDCLETIRCAIRERPEMRYLIWHKE